MLFLVAKWYQTCVNEQNVLQCLIKCLMSFKFCRPKCCPNYKMFGHQTMCLNKVWFAVWTNNLGRLGQYSQALKEHSGKLPLSDKSPASCSWVCFKDHFVIFAPHSTLHRVVSRCTSLHPVTSLCVCIQCNTTVGSTIILNPISLLKQFSWLGRVAYLNIIGHYFSSSLVHLFQNESKWGTFHMKMSSACSFISMQISHFHKNGFAHRLALKQRAGTRNSEMAYYTLQFTPSKYSSESG